MELKFTICKFPKTEGFNQIFGNNLNNHHPEEGKVSCTGGTSITDLLPDLQVSEGIVPIILRIEDSPFPEASHEMWIYGGPKNRRLSSKQPYLNQKKHLFAVGDAWLDIWCSHVYFPEHKDELFFKVYVHARRFDPLSLADANIPEA